MSYQECEYCGRKRGYACHNTRDMTDFAVDGDLDCLRQIALHDGGEKGLRYVVLNFVGKQQRG